MITYLNVSVVVKEDVFQLEISVHYSALQGIIKIIDFRSTFVIFDDLQQVNGPNFLQGQEKSDISLYPVT